jgi:hypothetical protein
MGVELGKTVGKFYTGRDTEKLKVMTVQLEFYQIF